MGSEFKNVTRCPGDLLSHRSSARLGPPPPPGATATENPTTYRTVTPWPPGNHGHPATPPATRGPVALMLYWPWPRRAARDGHHGHPWPSGQNDTVPTIC